MTPALTTSEVLAYRRFEKVPDESWVEWAVAMLAAGHDTPALRVMAGELGPFNAFEMWAMTDRVVAELGLTPFDDDRDAALALATVRIRQMLDGVILHEAGLHELWDLHLSLDHSGPLHDFYLLHCALGDLKHDDHQWYWPGADRSNIHDVIDERCRRWLAEHASEPGRLH